MNDVFRSEELEVSDERLRVLSDYWADRLLPSHPIYREFTKLAEQQTAAALLELVAARTTIKQMSRPSQNVEASDGQ